MTAIAGFVKDDRVWIGGDSAAVDGFELTLRADPKVFRNGDFLIGFSGSIRMGQLLRFALKPPEHEEGREICEYMCTSFVDAVRSCLKTGGAARRRNDEDSGGSFLVGYRGRLFSIDRDYQVGEARDGYDACGCGQAAACGALFATRISEYDPKDRLLIALQAAERHSAGVRGPFVIESI